MPTYISVEGKWKPAQEHVVLPHLSGTDKEVYDGPDRAAEFALFEAKEKEFGIDFRLDSDFLQRVKQLGFKDLNDYLDFIGYDSEKAKKTAEANLAKVNMHTPPERHEAVEPLGGGKDFTGQGNDVIGGFGEEKLRKRGEK